MRNLALALFEANGSLQSYYREKVAVRDIRERRASVRICVIDDKSFGAQTNLSNYGFRIQPIGDIKTIDEVRPYDLVLCDVMDVGTHFDIRKQGASLISEIRRCHPEKVVVAYSASAKSHAASREASIVADDFLKKDIDIDEWVANLDYYMSILLDPFKVWERIRVDLVDRGADTKDIIRLEDAYVRSILAKDVRFSLLISAVSKSAVKEDVRSIVNGLISSAAFSYIMAQ